jgi:hypothetical protein
MICWGRFLVVFVLANNSKFVERVHPTRLLSRLCKTDSLELHGFSAKGEVAVDGIESS